jgi:glycerol-3-phosphate O-acyltransferase
MGDIVNKSKKDMYEVQVTFDQNSFIQLFTLTYYRNTLTHIFFEEALITVAIASFGYQDLIGCKISV